MTDEERSIVHRVQTLLKRMEEDALIINEALGVLADKDAGGQDVADAHNISGGAWSAIRQMQGYLQRVQAKGRE